MTVTHTASIVGVGATESEPQDDTEENTGPFQRVAAGGAYDVVNYQAGHLYCIQGYCNILKLRCTGQKSIFES